MLSGEVDGHYDVVLLACKAYDLDSAVEAIAPALGSDSVILPFQNGIHHISILVDRFGPQRVLALMKYMTLHLRHAAHPGRRHRPPVGAAHKGTRDWSQIEFRCDGVSC
jgi:ketopantoate reductase